MAISKIENNSLASGVPSTAKLPAGTVLQVVNATAATPSTTTSTSFASTNITASITPTSATSKIFIIVNTVGAISSTSYIGMETIYRNSTNLGSSTGLTFVGAGQDVPLSMSFLDSPATTSSTTYTVYHRVNNAAATLNTGDTVGGVSQTSTITLMEIAA